MSLLEVKVICLSTVEGLVIEKTKNSCNLLKPKMSDDKVQHIYASLVKGQLQYITLIGMNGLMMLLIVQSV